MRHTDRLLILRLSWLWSLLLLGLMFVSCRSAGTLRGEHFVVPERFEALAPEAPDWQLTTNRRTPFLSRVEWTWYAPASASNNASSNSSPRSVSPRSVSSTTVSSKTQSSRPALFRTRAQGALFVEMRPLPPRYQSLPLEVIGELRYMKRLGTLGGAPSLESRQRIALDEREAIALVGSRLDRPFTWRHTLVVLVSQGMLVELGYHTLEADFERAAPAFERLLRQLKLTLPGPFDPNVLEETPFFYPWSPGLRGTVLQGKSRSQILQQPPIPRSGVGW